MPAASTNRYGDLLKEFYEGLKNDNLASPRLDRIVEVFNELSEMIEKMGVLAKLDRPEIYQPNFISSPLRAFHAYMTTDVSCNNNTWTPMLFDTSSGDNSIFDFYNDVKSKIGIDRSKFNVTVDGVLDWAASTVNDRVVRIRVFDHSDTEIASKELNNCPANTSAGFGLKQSFSYTEDIRGLFPNVAYFQLEGYQNSGGALAVENAVLSVRIA